MCVLVLVPSGEDIAKLMHSERAGKNQHARAQSPNHGPHAGGSCQRSARYALMRVSPFSNFVLRPGLTQTIWPSVSSSSSSCGCVSCTLKCEPS